MKARKGDGLYFLPLGGSGEIGMNLNLIGYGPAHHPRWLMIDCGVTFGDESVPGIDLIMGDPTFIAERNEDLLGLVLTHAHEDHIGAVPYLWPKLQCPVYATPFTGHLVVEKLKEVGLQGRVPLHIVPLGGTIELGPFGIELVTLTHSIPEPNALAIRTPLGTLLHTGDWKIDPDPLVGEVTDEAALRKLGDEGVLAMICDSTNVFSPGRSGSEATVRESLIELIGTLRGRIAVTAFASNVARLESVAHAAAAHGRHVVLVGRSMQRVVAAAKASGYLTDMADFIDERDAGWLPPETVLYLCTGSQGEPRAALSRIASGTHPNVTLEAGDTVIFSSRIIPGNEREIFAVQSQLAARGIEVMTEHDHLVHVSGHPCRDELADMYRWVRPKIAVPVHGELRHLVEHEAFARSLQVPQALFAPNGSMMQLAPGPAAIIDEVPHGRLYRDGLNLFRDGYEALRERRKLAIAGVVNAVLVLNKKGRLAAEPAISLHGVAVPDAEEMSATLRDIVDDVIEREVGRAWADDDFIAEMTRRALRKAIVKAAGVKPEAKVQIVRV